MAIDFPTSPTVGQIYTYSGITYTYTAQGVWASAGGIVASTTIAFMATISGGAQSIAGGSYVKGRFGLEVYDVGGFFDVTNRRWTPPAGKVALSCTVYVTGVLTDYGTHAVAFYKNGTVLREFTVIGYSTQLFGCSGYCEDNASGTDYYEAFIWATTTSGTGSVSNAPSYTWFAGHVISSGPGDIGPTGPAGPTDPNALAYAIALG